MTEYHSFPQTHWSLVRRAGATDSQARREALAVLLGRYQPALRSYLRIVRRLEPDEADDLLQAFITEQVLENDLLQRADASRGRFRALLLTSLSNFANSRYRAQKIRAADPLGDHQPSGTAPGPEARVQAAWARALVHQVIAAMREQCEKSGRHDVWAVFEGRILAEVFPKGEVVSYERLAQDLRLQSPAQAANLLVTAKRMYARLLRAAVGEYEQDQDAIDAEIADLRHSLRIEDPDDAE